MQLLMNIICLNPKRQKAIDIRYKSKLIRNSIDVCFYKRSNIKEYSFQMTVENSLFIPHIVNIQMHVTTSLKKTRKKYHNTE